VTTDTIPQTAPYLIRPGSEADLAAYVLMYNEIMTQEPDKVEDSRTTDIEQAEWFSSPRAAQRTWLLAFERKAEGSEGAMIGYATLERGESTEFGWLDMLVHPDQRRRGVGGALYATAEQQAQAQQLGKLYFGVSSRYDLLTSFLEQRGYQLDRYSWTMRLAAGVPVPEPRYPAGITTRRMVLGQDEQLLTDLRNVTFADHFGSVQRSLADTIHLTEETGFQADGVIFAYAGEQAVGYCYAVIWPDEVERRGESVGWIENLGVVPEQRRAGLGRALLLDGIRWLRTQVEHVELGVEGKNERALPLYSGVGFEQRNCWADMIKVLR